MNLSLLIFLTFSFLLPGIFSIPALEPEDDVLPEEEVSLSRKHPCLGKPSISQPDPSQASSPSSPDQSVNCTKVDFIEVSDDPFLSPELTSHLTALSSRHTARIYPPRPVLLKAIQRYAELPYFVPVGPSLFFCSLFLVLASWYIARILTSALTSAAKKVNLHPEIQEFPRINQYSLQQSKREAGLRREARNTWAWMAKKYLLMQNDPKVNVEIFGTTWSDFDLPKDVWGIVRSVLKAGAGMGKMKKLFQDSGVPKKRDKSQDKGHIVDMKVKDKSLLAKKHSGVHTQDKQLSKTMQGHQSHGGVGVPHKSPGTQPLPKIAEQGHGHDKPKFLSKTSLAKNTGPPKTTKPPSTHSQKIPGKSAKKPGSATDAR